MPVFGYALRAYLNCKGPSIIESQKKRPYLTHEAAALSEPQVNSSSRTKIRIMRLFITNIFAIAATAALATGYVAGYIGPSNAFFGAMLLVTAYTGYQFSLRDGMPLSEAARAIFTNPRSHPRLTSYISYVVCTVVGFVILAQTLSLYA